MCVDAAFTQLANSSMHLSLKRATAMRTEGCLLCSHHRRTFYQGGSGHRDFHYSPDECGEAAPYLLVYPFNAPFLMRAPRKLSFRKPRGPCNMCAHQRVPTQKKYLPNIPFFVSQDKLLGLYLRSTPPPSNSHKCSHK